MIRLSLSTPCSAPSSPSPSDQSPAVEYVLVDRFQSKAIDDHDQYSLFSSLQQARWWRGRVVQGQRECREKKGSAKEFKLRIIEYLITIYWVDHGDSLMVTHSPTHSFMISKTFLSCFCSLIVTQLTVLLTSDPPIRCKIRHLIQDLIQYPIQSLIQHPILLLIGVPIGPPI